MKILFLTHNPVTQPLRAWLVEQGNEVVSTPEVLEKALVEIKPEWIISYSYRHIIPKHVLDMHPNRFINLHISYLPLNRGADPNLWSILEGTQPGVTIHLIDEGVDTGPIIAQEEVELDESHTLESSYDLLQERIQDLFMRIWPTIEDGNFKAINQTSEGTYHSIRDGAGIKENLLAGYGYKIPLSELRRRYAINNSPMLAGDVFR